MRTPPTAPTGSTLAAAGALLSAPGGPGPRAGRRQP